MNPSGHRRKKGNEGIGKVIEGKILGKCIFLRGKILL